MKKWLIIKENTTWKKSCLQGHILEKYLQVSHPSPSYLKTLFENVNLNVISKLCMALEWTFVFLPLITHSRQRIEHLVWCGETHTCAGLGAIFCLREDNPCFKSIAQKTKLTLQGQTVLTLCQILLFFYVRFFLYDFSSAIWFLREIGKVRNAILQDGIRI